MPELNATRRKLKLTIGTLLAVDLLAVGLLFSPLVGSVASRRAELNQLWQELQSKTRQVEPLRGLDQKIPVAGRQIQQFYAERFPEHESTVAEALGKIAQENNVKLASVKYQEAKDTQVDLLPLDVELNVEGNYPQLARFLNGLEREKVFFIVNSVQLEGQNGPVKLDVKLETYLKVGA